MKTTIAMTLALLLGTAGFVEAGKRAARGAVKTAVHKAKTEQAAAKERFIADCVHERTGPDGGITAREAIRLCTGIVRHDAKIAKAAARALKAIAACEQAIVDACVDAAEPEGSADCLDEALRPAFATCRAGVQ